MSQEHHYIERSNIRVREIGRYAQQYIDYILTLPAEQQQEATEQVVEALMLMFAPTRKADDYRIKIWAHLLEVADYQLNAVSPLPLPVRKTEQRPALIPYPLGQKTFRYYGRLLPQLIQKAIALDDIEKQKEFSNLILAYMKMSYCAWNSPEVSNATILQDFKRLSDHKLQLPEIINFDVLLHNPEALVNNHDHLNGTQPRLRKAKYRKQRL
jgi:hypothetical protein